MNEMERKRRKRRWREIEEVMINAPDPLTSENVVQFINDIGPLPDDVPHEPRYISLEALGIVPTPKERLILEGMNHE